MEESGESTTTLSSSSRYCNKYRHIHTCRLGKPENGYKLLQPYVIDADGLGRNPHRVVKGQIFADAHLFNRAVKYFLVESHAASTKSIVHGDLSMSSHLLYFIMPSSFSVSFFFFHKNSRDWGGKQSRGLHAKRKGRTQSFNGSHPCTNEMTT